MIIAAIEVGPVLGLVLMTLATGIVSALTSWLALRKADKAVTEIAAVHKAVNSTASALATDAKVNEAKYEALQAELLRVSKELASSQGQPAQPVAAPPAAAPVLPAAPSDNVHEIAVKVTNMEVEDMTVHKTTPKAGGK